jgi:hypothetical protein
VRLSIAAPLCALALAAAAGCGGGDDEGAASDLTVTVHPQGQGGPARERHVSCDSGCGVRARDLAPVPSDRACAQVYGGPATATVTGTLEGERVDAAFKLTDACEIARWKRNAELLGKPPR